MCLAVWLASAGRSLTDKFLAIVFPITAFVAAGFEHSIANMYFLPMGLALKGQASVVQASGLSVGEVTNLDIGATFANVAAATIGNVISGAVLVGLVLVRLPTNGLACIEVTPSGRRWTRRTPLEDDWLLTDAPTGTQIKRPSCS